MCPLYRCGSRGLEILILLRWFSSRVFEYCSGIQVHGFLSPESGYVGHPHCSSLLSSRTGLWGYERRPFFFLIFILDSHCLETEIGLVELMRSTHLGISTQCFFLPLHHHHHQHYVYWVGKCVYKCHSLCLESRRWPCGAGSLFLHLPEFQDWNQDLRQVSS